MKTVKLQHDRVNFVYSTDWHTSTQPPGRRQDDYQTAILAKITFIRDLTIRLKGVALCGGDVFHVKNPKSQANGFGLLFPLLQLLRQFPVYGSIGNHDLSMDRMDSLPTQPLGILVAAGVYHNLNDESVLFVNKDETVKVSVETFPYEHGAETLERLLKTGSRPEGVTHRIGIVHAYGEPGNGGSMFGEPKIGYNQIQHLDFDFLLWGHDHSRKETVEVGNITHINLGALARAAYDYDEIDRPVVATVLSFAEDGIRLKEVEIPVTPLNIAFKTADKPVTDVVKSDELKEFFNAMDEQIGEVGDESDPGKILNLLCPSDEPELLTLTKELCEIYDS
jgi:DNA repair exonuclease SbcCD nuclease subunit